MFSSFFGFKSQLSSLLAMLTLLGPFCLTYKMREKTSTANKVTVALNEIIYVKPSTAPGTNRLLVNDAY